MLRPMSTEAWLVRVQKTRAVGTRNWPRRAPGIPAVFRENHEEESE